MVEAGSDEDAYLWRLGRTVQRIRRKLHKWTQVELAKEIGREMNTISRWENGKTSLSAIDLVELWRALRVPGEWLLNPTDSMTELDRRIEALRQQRLREAAAEAARLDAEAESSQRDDDEASAPRGTQPRRMPPRKPRGPRGR